jgi:hypothetical protein
MVVDHVSKGVVQIQPLQSMQITLIIMNIETCQRKRNEKIIIQRIKSNPFTAGKKGEQRTKKCFE